MESASGDLWAVRVTCLRNGLLNQQRFYGVTGGTAYREAGCSDAKKYAASIRAVAKFRARRVNDDTFFFSIED